jgi:hypothetical protein
VNTTEKISLINEQAIVGWALLYEQSSQRIGFRVNLPSDGQISVGEDICIMQ